MIRKIYHGSNHIIEKPMFGYGKPYNDYGHGFYCTDTLDMAKEWGAEKQKNGYANCYELLLDDLTILDLNDEKYCILHWLTLLLQNREFDTSSPLALEAKEYLSEHFSLPVSDYDCIIGYRADDSYFSFAQDFINGTISYRQLGNAMHLGKMGLQFVLKSERAFNQLLFTGYEIADSKEWYTKKMLRDKSARREYFDTERNRRHPSDIYIMNIMDEEMKSDDARLR